MLTLGKRNSWMFVAVFAGCVLVGIISACHPQKEKPYANRVRETPPPTLHAVHSQHLTEIMYDLERLSEERLPQELDPEVDQPRRLRELADVALSLATAAADIPLALPEGEMPETDQELFLILVDRLRDQAIGLNQCATERNLDVAEIQVEDIQATCDACHNLFRAVPPLKD